MRFVCGDVRLIGRPRSNEALINTAIVHIHISQHHRNIAHIGFIRCWQLRFNTGHESHRRGTNSRHDRVDFHIHCVLEILVPPFNRWPYKQSSCALQRKVTDETRDLLFEWATWQGKTKLLPDARKRIGLCVGSSKKQGSSRPSVADVLPHHVAVESETLCDDQWVLIRVKRSDLLATRRGQSSRGEEKKSSFRLICLS